MDKLEKLHQLLQSKGLDNKTFEEFQANFGDNPEKQKQLHSFLVSKQIDNKEDKQTPQVQTMIDLVNMLIQSGRSNVEIESAFTKRYKGKRLQRQRELYHKVMKNQEIDKETLEQNSSVNDVLTYLGFEFNPNQTKLDLDK